MAKATTPDTRQGDVGPDGFEPFVNADFIVRMCPGLTKTNLAQLRYEGKGPKFYKPSPRVVLYRWSEVREWIEGHAQIQTDNVPRNLVPGGRR